MKIAYLCRNFHKDRGGIETYVRELARCMGLKGHTVHIIAEDIGGFYREPIAPNVRIQLIKMKACPFPGYWRLDGWFPLDDLRFVWGATKKIRQLVLSGELDVVESMDYFRQGFYAAFFSQVPMVQRLHGWVFNRQEGRVNPVGSLSFKEKLWWRMQQKSLDAADVISAVSGDFADYAASIWRIDHTKVRVIPNAADMERYRPLPGRSRPPTVVFVARLAKIKGVKVLADAIPRVVAQVPDVKFYFAGKDLFWREEGLTAAQYITQKAAPGNAVILGEVSSEEIIRLYQNSSVCVLPSLYEPFGITALEAMACGCTLVASRAGGLQEIVKDGEDGLLVEPGDPSSLAEAIVRLLKDPALCESLSMKGRQKVQAVYSYDRLAENVLASYEEAVKTFTARKRQS